MTTDDLHLLREFRAEIPAPREETRRRLYAYATSQPKLMFGGRRRRSRQLVLIGTTVGVACLASAIIVAHTTTNNPTTSATSRTSFVVADNHDGTLTVTLHKRSALPALNASLVSYGLKAKLPRDVSARTLSLTATCPKVPTLPGNVHPVAVAVGSPHEPLPGNLRQALKNCVLHTTS